jgi:23S rRNA (guanosine2251-2'-O)-methyltransferase
LETDSPAGAGKIRTLEDLWPTVGEDSLVMLLDGITDPRNLGAVMRAADQFGADAVIVPRRRSVGADADTLSRSSAGAVEWVPLIEVPNMPRALEEFKKKTVSGSGEPIWTGKPLPRSISRVKQLLLWAGKARDSIDWSRTAATV